MEEPAQYQKQYAALNNEELLLLWADKESLNPLAATALSIEIGKRGLVADQEAQRAVAELQIENRKKAEAKAKRSARLVRLGILLTTSVGFAVLFSCAFIWLAPHTWEPKTVGRAAGDLALLLGFGEWVISNFFPQRWLTTKRVWIAGIVLNGTVFALLLGSVL